MVRALKILQLALAETVMPADLTRTPEPTAEMSSAESILGFHQEGATSLLPVYHFNARAIHALAPRGSHIVDLGSGSARFLAYLANCRPDLRITGIDLARDMVHVGRQMLAQQCLQDRVRLMIGDMRDFRSQIEGKIDLISSVFALHHLPTYDDLIACLREVSGIVSSERARLWVFDHARPRREDTAQQFPEVFTPGASSAFKLDSCNSLKASWSFDELLGALRSTVALGTNNFLARLLPLYQVHWIAVGPTRADENLWSTPTILSPDAMRNATSLARLLQQPPGW